MGGSSERGAGVDGDEGCCGVGDTSPGTIVWVRRRNGSWWPGRILGPDELPPSQIMSRSGTPVKLLGREDASVDWYNLEKSKRVKAFRCGEFDACIEKAEATQGTLSKKREKYARREDAILHALELERKQLASKHQTQCFRPANISACTKHRQHLGSTRYKSKNSKKRKDVSAPPHAKKETDQYFLHAGSKRNFSESLARDTSENLISTHLNDFSYARHTQGGVSLESKDKGTIVKKNRLDGSDFDESIEKCDRRRPLVQVLQSSAKLPHHSQHNDDYGYILIGGDKDPSPATYRTKSKYVYLPSDSGETHSHSDLPSAQIASTGTDFETESYLQHPGSFSEEQTSSDLVQKHISESSERECSESETEDDAELLQSANMILPPESRAHDAYFLPASDKVRHVDNDDDEDDDDEVTYCTQLNESEEEDGSSDLVVSQWHMKGKRNNHNAAKRSMDMTDGNPWLDKPNGFMKGSLHKTNDRNNRKETLQTSNQQLLEQSFYQIKEELNYDSDETDLFEDTLHSEVKLYCGRTYPSSLKTNRDLSRNYSYFNDYYSDSSKISPLNKDADQIFRFNRNAYWDGSSFYQKYSSHLGGMGPILFDVDLKVQASYQGEHVPLVSLMSRLNGKAIVGHPIRIEILEDGSTDHLVSCGDVSLEDSTGAPPAWRTGRRTAMQRIPRSNLSGASLGGDDEGGLAYPDWEMKPVFRKYSTSSNHQIKVDKKSMSNAGRSSACKSQKKPSKKATLSSQKVRTLSSISTGKRHHGEGSQAKAHRHSGIFGGLIKPEGVVPLVTCVPAKVVFTRILEAIGRPPLALAHRVRMASPAVRDPS